VIPTIPPELASAILAATALGAACASLSVLVVAKRWAFIGEGIAHAGFGGAGTAWLLCLLFPSATFLASSPVIYAISIAFCALVAALIASLTRRRYAAVDTVVGIFLVASLAWGFVAYGLYSRATGHMPPQFADYLGFERLRGLSTAFVTLAVVVSAGVLTAVHMLRRELLFYATDEKQAEASGVNVSLIHYGLIALLTLLIVVGMRLMGTVLVVALLILPGATGLLLGKSTRAVWTLAITTGILAGITGPILSHNIPAIPEGPAIVLFLFLAFILTFIFARARGPTTTWHDNAA
jgi:ABC-type Mn2+/Zn2+ transport system permease subunit